MNAKASTTNLGAVVLVRGGVLSANARHRIVAMGGTHRQPCHRRATIAMRSRILQIAFSLVLGSAPIAFAQMDHDLPNGIHLAYASYGPQGASASRYVSPGGFTNQHVTLPSIPAPKGDPDPDLSYSVPPSQQRGEVDLNQPSLTKSVRLTDPAPTATPLGWRIGGGGVLNYTTPNQRWHLVFGYKPDLGALREDFDRLHSFSLRWYYSLGKLKPASWAVAPAGSEHVRPPVWPPKTAASPGSF
jgi:hypothetical protein